MMSALVGCHGIANATPSRIVVTREYSPRADEFFERAGEYAGDQFEMSVYDR